MSDQKHKSRIVLITGCSSGFGLVTAARLAAAGNQVYATMRNLDKQAPLLSEVNRRGGAVKVLRLD
ncbi:MAG: SDR family NAD(P)-dependent oxidoreductase, partial [Candidatus Omnitrophica bacterium]|nr:SDR family NAD(P)-dependent oxidoreductase [Candidatus Omnitrophota bacterium]